jgi:hypothetical protein
MRNYIVLFAAAAAVAFAAVAAIGRDPCAMTPRELVQIRAGDGSCEAGANSGVGCTACQSDGNGFYVACDDAQNENACIFEPGDCEICVSFMTFCTGKISRYSDAECSPDDLLDQDFDDCFRKYNDTQQFDCDPPDTFCV